MIVSSAFFRRRAGYNRSQAILSINSQAYIGYIMLRWRLTGLFDVFPSHIVKQNLLQLLTPMAPVIHMISKSGPFHDNEYLSIKRLLRALMIIFWHSYPRWSGFRVLDLPGLSYCLFCAIHSPSCVSSNSVSHFALTFWNFWVW